MSLDLINHPTMNELTNCLFSICTKDKIIEYIVLSKHEYFDDEWWCEATNEKDKTGSWLYSGQYIRQSKK